MCKRFGFKRIFSRKAIKDFRPKQFESVVIISVAHENINGRQSNLNWHQTAKTKFANVLQMYIFFPRSQFVSSKNLETPSVFIFWQNSFYHQTLLFNRLINCFLCLTVFSLPLVDVIVFDWIFGLDEYCYRAPQKAPTGHCFTPLTNWLCRSYSTRLGSILHFFRLQDKFGLITLKPLWLSPHDGFLSTEHRGSSGSGAGLSTWT